METIPLVRRLRFASSAGNDGQRTSNDDDDVDADIGGGGVLRRRAARHDPAAGEGPGQGAAPAGPALTLTAPLARSGGQRRLSRTWDSSVLSSCRSTRSAAISAWVIG